METGVKISTWTILIFALLFTFFIPYDYNSNLSEKVEEESLRIEGYALSAAQAALGVADMGNDSVFGSKNVRKDVVLTFYEIYARCINMPENYSKVKYNIPCIIMADNDGYYVAYTQWTDTVGLTAYTDVITEKQQYLMQYGTFVVIYQMNDVVTVSDLSKTEELRIKGTYEYVNKELKKIYGQIPQDLNYFNEYATFCDEKNTAIAKKIENTARYYVNTHNGFFNTKDVQYEISLPTSKDKENAGLINTPSVIGFVQGKQGELNGKISNIYAYVAADLEYEYLYKMTTENDEIYYHTEMCEDAKNAYMYGSAMECAKNGAIPHDCVFNIERYKKREE